MKLDAGVEIEAPSNGLSTGDRCHAIVRPEKLLISTNGSAPVNPNWPAVEGQVESSVYLGTSTQIVVRLAGDVRMTVLVPNADEAERARLPGGGADVASPGHQSTSTWSGSRRKRPPRHERRERQPAEPVDEAVGGRWRCSPG